MSIPNPAETPPPEPEHRAAAGQPTPLQWLGRLGLAVVLVVAGLFVALLGPLLALACSECTDGVRSVRFPQVLSAGQVLAVLTTVGGAAGAFFPRGGTRVAAGGLLALLGLLLVMVVLGRVPG